MNPKLKKGLIEAGMAVFALFIGLQVLRLGGDFLYVPNRNEFQLDVWRNGSELERAMMLRDLAARLERERPTRRQLTSLLGPPDYEREDRGVLTWTPGISPSYSLDCKFGPPVDGVSDPAIKLQGVRVFPPQRRPLDLFSTPEYQDDEW